MEYFLLVTGLPVVLLFEWVVCPKGSSKVGEVSFLLGELDSSKTVIHFRFEKSNMCKSFSSFVIS